MSIELSNDIRNKVFSQPLSTEKMKYFIEYYALAALRYCYDNEYDDLQLHDAPDLQSSDRSIGVEVTEVAIETRKAIDGDWLQYRKSNDEKYKNKAENRGAEINNEHCLYPSVSADDELECIKTVFTKKLKKLSSYLNSGFQKIALIMVLDEPPIPDTAFKWIEVIKECQANATEKYDTVFFLYSGGLSCYDCNTGEVEYKTINREDVDALHKYARIAFESIP